MTTVLSASVLLASTLGCRPEPPCNACLGYKRSIESWRRARLEKLKGPGGWLRLAGLFWLNEGQSSIGSGKDQKITLPDHAPGKLGVLSRRGEVITLSLAPTVKAAIKGEPVAGSVAMRSDADPAGPDRVQVGDLTLLIIKRGERLGLRLFDNRAETLKIFRGLDYFPVQGRWRVYASFEPYREPRELQVSTVIETTEEMTAPGELVFEIDGRQHRLTPFAEVGSRDLFIVFGDRTNGTKTYGGGRFLTARLPRNKDVRVELDFNRAYNPPCAFTDFATCPVPRKENRLRARVAAGEKVYSRPTHD